MPHRPTDFSRRAFIGTLSAAGALAAFAPSAPASAAADGTTLTRAIPNSGERLPIIGMGSWITFNVGSDQGCATIASKYCKHSSIMAAA